MSFNTNQRNSHSCQAEPRSFAQQRQSSRQGRHLHDHLRPVFRCNLRIESFPIEIRRIQDIQNHPILAIWYRIRGRIPQCPFVLSGEVDRWIYRFCRCKKERYQGDAVIRDCHCFGLCAGRGSDQYCHLGADIGGVWRDQLLGMRNRRWGILLRDLLKHFIIIESQCIFSCIVPPLTTLTSPNTSAAEGDERYLISYR